MARVRVIYSLDAASLLTTMPAPALMSVLSIPALNLFVMVVKLPSSSDFVIVLDKDVVNEIVISALLNHVSANAGQVNNPWKILSITFS